MDTKNLEEIARIFDSIISSPSDAVQSAFKNLVVLASLSHEQAPDSMGPFENIMSRLACLEHELKELRKDVQYSNNDFTYHVDDTVKIDLNGMSMNQTMFSNIAPLDVGTITLTDSGSSYAWDGDTIKISEFNIKVK